MTAEFLGDSWEYCDLRQAACYSKHPAAGCFERKESEGRGALEKDKIATKVRRRMWLVDVKGKGQIRKDF